MAEFQWWLLIVGLVAGGTIVALLMMDASRRDEDVPSDEAAAEATFIAARLAGTDRPIEAPAVARVLAAHREYLRLPPPDALVEIDPAEGTPTPPAWSARDRHPDEEPDDVGHGGRASPDRDLPGA
jgi:hypothetical protein